MQWLQVIAFPVWMNLLGHDIERYSESADSAMVFGCIGLLLMALVVRLITKNLPALSKSQLYEEVVKINEQKLLLVYVLSTLTLTSLGFVFGIASAVTQLLINLSSIKWVFFMLYGFVVWIKKKINYCLLSSLFMNSLRLCILIFQILKKSCSLQLSLA